MDALIPRLEAWRRKLLDLSRRNRLLYFKPTRRTTIEAGDEVPAELYRELVLEGKGLRFLPAARPEARAARARPRARPALAVAAPSGKEGPLEPPAPIPEGPEVGISLRRCPFCHEEVGAGESPLVCSQCLSRHHAECWDEHGRCASCAANRPMAEVAPAAEPEPEAPTGPPAWTRKEREKLAPQHTDEAIQTEQPEAELAATLLAMHRAAASTLEEEGFNALALALGFLHWVDQDGVAARAPILLLPVELRRRALTSRYTLLAGEDDPLWNPALTHRLEQEGIALPELPDADELDPDDLFERVAEAVKDRPGWRVTSEVALALFSFTKFVMFRDLELHRERILRHPLVRRLLGDQTPAPPQAGPAPEPGTCVLDADGSQLEAISAALQGQDLVLEGPPGTGKSQTIANLIAEALSRGKTVLFVSEKMAALEVVKDRLAQAGVGDACLELHSKKANKRALVQELARTLDQPHPPDHAEDDALAALDRAAQRLDAHPRALHAPWGAAKLTPWELVAALEEVRDAPEVSLALDCASWTREELRRREEALEELARREKGLGDPKVHPCRGLGPIETGHAELVALRGAIDQTMGELEKTEALAEELGRALGTPPPATPAAVEASLALLPRLVERDRPTAAEALHPGWDGPVPASLIELRARESELAKKLSERLQESAWSLPEPLALAQRLQGWQGKWWRAFAPSFWSDRGAARAVLVPGADTDPALLVRDLTTLAKGQELRGKLAASQAEGKALFGSAWGGEADALRKRAEQVQALRKAVKEKVVPVEALEPLPDPERARAAGERLADGLDALKRAGWEQLQRAGQFDEAAGLGGPFATTPLARTRERLGELLAARESWDEWAAREGALAAARPLGLEPFVEAARALEVPPAALARSFRRATFLAWLDHAERERPPLRKFERAGHERVQAEFRELDRRRQELARVRLRHQLAERRPDPQWEAAEDSELGLLQRELRRKRGHLPIRQLLHRVPGALVKLKPCLLMSPLTVAQFTDPAVHAFDLVVFDEASQIAPEDALGAIARGRQVVVVGDGKQLPPTPFFQAAMAAGQESEAEPDLESVLDECLARGVPRRMLRWHYRSRHESLIAFSNHAFYGARLCSFPSPHDGRGKLGLRRVLVSGGTYERGGSGKNQREAEAVAAAVIEHLRAFPERSLGVGAFSAAQQEAIQDAVEAKARAHPELQELLAPEKDEHFFVKNLENLQGDERDVVFISIGYGPDKAGKLSLNFGPLNQAGGERRLNVLVTRAREQVVLFTSFEPEALDPDKTQSEGVRLLRAYLDYASRGVLPRRDNRAVEPPGKAALRQSIRQELEARGHRVAEELGTSDVRVDLAVGTQDGSGQALGLLLDGPRWAGFARARDRERLVPELLQDQGWRLHAVWALDWHRRRKKALDGLLAALEAASQLAPEDPPPPPGTAPPQRPGTVRLRAASARLAPVKPYRALEVAPRGDAAAFGEVEDEELAALVTEVVKVEGPVHVEEIERRALAHWELTRSGKSARDRVAQALSAAVRAGRIRRAGDFLWPPKLESAPVRDRSQSGPRDPELIPPEELDAALALVVEKEGRVPREALVTQAARLLGFPRGGAKIRAGLEERLEALLAVGRLADGGGVVVNPAGA